MGSDEGAFGFGLKPKSRKVSLLSADHLLTLEELDRSELLGLLQLAAEVKKSPKQFHRSLAGRTLGMIFAKPSTRTRVSFEAGMNQLGGSGVYLSSKDLQLGRGETISDTSKVLSRYVDAVMIRTFAHSDVEELAAASDVPVINGLTDDWHPCQILADLLTICEVVAPDEIISKDGGVDAIAEKLADVKLAYIGDGNNMANSLMVGAGIVGIEMAVAAPSGFQVDKKLAARIEKNYGSKVTLTDDPILAVKGADFIYTDVWASMGQEEEHAKRVEVFAGFQVNEKLVKATGKKNTKVLHCLPAHRGEEISAGIMDADDALVWDQAENRLHAQKALLLALILKDVILR